MCANKIIGHKIIGWAIKNEDTFWLALSNEKIYKFYAQADCCSESWFEFQNEDQAFNNNLEISNIESVSVELPKSNRQDIDKNDRFDIYYEDGSSTSFYLRNSSNGYYSGWLSIEEDRNSDILIPKINDGDGKNSFYLRKASNDYYSGWSTIKEDQYPDILIPEINNSDEKNEKDGKNGKNGKNGKDGKNDGLVIRWIFNGFQFKKYFIWLLFWMVIISRRLIF